MNYLLKQFFNPECKAMLFSKYIPMYYQQGLEAIEKDLKSQKWTLESYDTKGDLIVTQKVIPIVKIEENNRDISIRIYLDTYKIVLKKFSKKYPIDYSLVYVDDLMYSKLTWDGQLLTGFDTITIEFKI